MIILNEFSCENGHLRLLDHGQLTSLERKYRGDYRKPIYGKARYTIEMSHDGENWGTVWEFGTRIKRKHSKTFQKMAKSLMEGVKINTRL